MNWQTTSTGKFPPSDKVLIIEVESCCFLAVFDPKSKIFRSEGRPALAFDPNKETIRWAELERQVQRGKS